MLCLVGGLVCNGVVWLLEACCILVLDCFALGILYLCLAGLVLNIVVCVGYVGLVLRLFTLRIVLVCGYWLCRLLISLCYYVVYSVVGSFVAMSGGLFYGLCVVRFFKVAYCYLLLFVDFGWLLELYLLVIDD